jgi:hypothetical protein
MKTWDASMNDVYVGMNDLSFVWTLYCVCHELYVIVNGLYVFVNELYDFVLENRI